MVAHAHPYPSQNEKLRAGSRNVKLFAQQHQLDERIRAVEHPDTGIFNGLQYFTPPLVNQMHQRATVTFVVQHRRCGDSQQRLAATYLIVPVQMLAWHTAGLKGIDLAKRIFDDFDHVLKSKI